MIVEGDAKAPVEQPTAVNSAAILAALDEIVSSPEFGRAERPARFLRHLVETTLEGENHRLKESVLGVEVFGRPPSWDPRLDAIVRQEAARLRKRLARYYESAEIGSAVRIELPVGTYVPVFRGVFQSVQPPAPTRKPVRPWLYLVAVVLVCAVASIAVWSFHRGRPAASYKPSSLAQELVVKGRFDLQPGTMEGVKRAEADFQHAIDVDPKYAVAYLELAQAKLAEAPARGSTYRTEVERDNAEELSRKALQLDPSLPDAHALLARLAMEYEWDWAGAEREFRLALAAPPSAKAELSYAFFLIIHHRFAEADEHLNRAQKIEPFDTFNMQSLAQDRYLEGRFAEVHEIAQRLLTLHPTVAGAQAEMAASHIWDGHPELALGELKQIKQSFPSLPFYQAMALAGAGERAEALKLTRPYEEKYPDAGVALQWIAKVYALLGDEENTVKWLERSADQREWQVLTIAVNPVFASMENSPGFRALKQRMGLQ